MRKKYYLTFLIRPLRPKVGYLKYGEKFVDALVELGVVEDGGGLSPPLLPLLEVVDVGVLLALAFRSSSHGHDVGQTPAKVVTVDDSM